MPNEKKKRGRRAAEKERKEQEIQDGPSAKRQKTDRRGENFTVTGDAGDDFIKFNDQTCHDGQKFYGLLTEDEQAYYTNVNNKITANDFENDQDRANFVDAVYRESVGKEIKLASSQSCSRHLERIIRISTPDQLRCLFLAFLTDLDHLVQHRFGSHVCETLFVQSAQYVEENSRTDTAKSFESLFLQVSDTLKANVGFLLTERFASHTLRMLLLILSGLPLEDKEAQQLVASRKKESLDLPQDVEMMLRKERKVPHSFKRTRRQLVKAAISNLDSTYLRALATSPIGNPVLQLLLRIELSQDGSKSEDGLLVLNKLIPDQNFEPESDSSRFISSLVYDPTGAFLVQNLVRFLPGKLFKKMYKNLFKDRIGKLAKNEIASYVAVSIFERIGGDDLLAAGNLLVPEIPGLVERHRIAVIKSYIECSNKRGVLHTKLRHDLRNLFAPEFDKKPWTLLQNMLKFDESTAKQSTDEKIDVDFHGASLAQVMLRVEQFSHMVHDSLLAQNDRILCRLAKNSYSSVLMQHALAADTSSAAYRRQLVTRLYDYIPQLAVDQSGSHVIDVMWRGTMGSHFQKEKIAGLLAKNEQKLRESVYGRNVWKNWHMDVYQRRVGEWTAIAKGVDQDAGNEQPEKTAIESARERAAQQKAQRSNQQHHSNRQAISTRARINR